MDERKLYNSLRDALKRMGVTIREERVEHGSGGFCRLDAEPLIVLSPDLSLAKRIDFFLNALRRLDTSGIYLPPVIRDMLEED